MLALGCVQFPMPNPPQAQPDGAEEGRMPMTVGVGMLKSYQQMGVAEVACTQGCSCEPQAFDLHQEEKVSFPLERDIIELWT